MELFIKTYGIFIGFFLGVIGMYLKHLIDRKLEYKKAQNKLNKLFLMINESKPPKWIRTYNESDLKIRHKEFGANDSNMSVFESRIHVINSFYNVISKDVYSHLGIDEIIRFDSVKWELEKILKSIDEEKNKINALSYSGSEKMHNDYFDDDSKDSIEKDYDKHQRELDHLIRISIFHFGRIEGRYNRMIEACNKDDFSKLSYLVEDSHKNKLTRQ